jgi:hypothetical protein
MVDETDLTDIYRMIYPTTAQCTFFSAISEVSPNIYHILGHRASFNKYKNIK